MVIVIRRLLLFTGLLLSFLVILGERDAVATRNSSRDHEGLIQLLLGRPIEWPRNIARPLVEAMPERVVSHLSNQTDRTLPAYLARASSHPLHPRNVRADFYVASTPTGGSFIAMTTSTYQGARVVWDTLMPISILYPKLEFENVDGDPAYEAICSGQLVNSDLYEWAVIDWDSTGGHLVAPRLDQPADYLLTNRLIGRGFRLVDDSTSAYKEIEIIDALPVGVPVTDSDQKTRGTRTFRYDPDVGGYLPVE